MPLHHYNYQASCLTKCNGSVSFYFVTMPFLIKHDYNYIYSLSPFIQSCRQMSMFGSTK